MKVTSIEEALKLVREKYPNAIKQGSTFDWTFISDRKIVGIAITNRRSRKCEWELTIYEKPVVDS